VPQHIGMIACSAEGAALCYRTICEEGARQSGGHAHPEISMHTHSLADYVERIERDDWRGVGELMLASADKLARIGADFLIVPDNTVHQALPHIRSDLPRPCLHIAEVVATQAFESGWRRLGLLGTRWLVESETYPEALAVRGLECLRPDRNSCERIHRIIMEELVAGVLTAEASICVREAIARLEADGADAVVLACTELPLIVTDANSPLPVLDSTRLLARAALRRAAQAAS
jgi:aspartate racemase